MIQKSSIRYVLPKSAQIVILNAVNKILILCSKNKDRRVVIKRRTILSKKTDELFLLSTEVRGIQLIELISPTKIFSSQ